MVKGKASNRIKKLKNGIKITSNSGNELGRYRKGKNGMAERQNQANGAWIPIKNSWSNVLKVARKRKYSVEKL